MTVQQSWETQLLVWAREALTSTVYQNEHPLNREQLDSAYEHCAEITKANSRTFYMAAGLLPQERKYAAHALYAFCRVTDDLVDNAETRIIGERQLQQWREKASLPHPPADESVLQAWADTQEKFGIPHGYAEQLIDGIARDLRVDRYQTFDELAEYCYGVASTVGLMVMHLVGFSDEAALPYAIKLGVALQLTNILRDIGEDWADRNRVYLPQDELIRFNLSEKDIDAGIVTDDWRRFMQFQIVRTRQLYAEAYGGYKYLNREGRFAIVAAATLYKAILDDIENNDYDVFSRRAHTSFVGKLRRLPSIWWISATAR